MLVNDLRSSLVRMGMVVAIGGASLFAPAAEAAVLDGQTIGVNTHSEDTLGNVLDGTVYYTIAPNSSPTGATFLTAIYTDQQITLTNLDSSSSVTFLSSDFFTGAPYVFNGLHFQLSAPTLTSLTIDPASTVTGAGAYFNSLNLWVGLAGVTFNTGDTLILDINGYTPPTTGVPEPASWALLLLGFGGVGAAMRRANRRETVEA
ncbi:PEPxxWA-CTERM sorting domain-containing protein [uncultured Rhodoblastus sp.]|uniref:PEPxxWA-CTERM sorting domain-containing protein n=1 Tax=uncultured Rhodoblastus sp. TaxID=543037 RepID=UPI0025DB19D5|nr:PEPxxWA-CTERM sorting domain-containing protein [uncultured Rhodoblastus sp.]